MLRRAVLIVGLVIVCCGLATQANGSIVVNGGFETAAFAPAWTLWGTHLYGGYEFVTVAKDGDNMAGAVGYPILHNPQHTGTYGAVIGPSVGDTGGIQQTLSTVAGQEYKLSFWLKQPVDDQPATPNHFSVTWGGNTVFSATNWVSLYVEMDYIVTAQSSSTLLTFGGGAEDGFGLDDVSVTPIPEPGTIIVWSLLGLGWVCGMRVWRRRGNAVDVGGSAGRQPWSPEARTAIHQIIERAQR